MKNATMLLTAALLAGPGPATAEGQAAPQQPPRADQQGSEAEKTKGYGYGTPSGREAAGSAGQAAKKKRKKAKRAKAPRREQGATAKDRAAPDAAPAPGAQRQGSREQRGAAPAR